MSDQITEKPADFPAIKAYPDEPALAPPAVAKPAGSTLRYAVAAVLFVFIVGAIAWITQFMPNWRTRTTAPVPIGDASLPALVKFSFTRAVWDRDDEGYALEMERGKKGHFDFPFENPTDQAAEFGLLGRECDCSYLEVCLVPSAEWEVYRQEILKNPLTAKAGVWTWEKLADSPTKGFDVPGGAEGLARVGWHGRREPGIRLQLKSAVWHQPRGNPSQRRIEKLEVPIVMAAPVLFTPGRISVGILGPNDSAVAQATLWSATRDNLNLTWGGSPDPLFTYEGKPFSPEECRDLEKKMRQGGENTRVCAASHFQVKVQGQAGGKQLDQGPFSHKVTFLLDDDRVRGPEVVGAVTGEVLVGNAEDRGKIDLKTFKAKEGVTREVSLWAGHEGILELESQTPAVLEVKLKKEEKSGTRTKWLMQVTVPPNAQYGAFSEESVIILRTQTIPPRFIRIPVTGNGSS